MFSSSIPSAFRPVAGRTQASRPSSFVVRADSSSNNSKPPPLDPVELVRYGYKIPSRRRVLGSFVLGSSVALGGNLFGVTSKLLSLDGGKFAGSTGLDVLVPVNGFRRARDLDNGYEFLYPAEWLADQRLYQVYAQDVERRAALDPPSLRDSSLRRRRNSQLPTAAFGPAGSTGEVNVSVIVADISPTFRLRQLGGPEEAATRILSNTIAPEGSGKKATLINFGQRTEGLQTYYMMEYEVKGPTFHRHNVSTYTSRDGFLFTFNAQSPVDEWPRLADRLRASAASFSLLAGGRGAEFPEGL